ncbi:MAG: DAK2 domain-containing protein [Eggerthellaceae bacterium]|nr:DAK2 domain-containing protein [Eggerthellaceae bacterium]
MARQYGRHELLQALIDGTALVSMYRDDINKLNVFPVPDGDTGTNLFLTLDSVVHRIDQLPSRPSGVAIRRAITEGALMGARGNSGVILSQIIRGFCEGSGTEKYLTTQVLDAAFTRAKDVAYKAVKKPVEGTILTVLREVALVAKRCNKKKLSIDESLDLVVEEAYASVKRTPELLAVLKENNVVDAGGYGFAIWLDGISASLQGKKNVLDDAMPVDTAENAPKVEIEQINDWEGSKFRYCTEFLVHSDDIDVDTAKSFLSTMGDCELLVGNHPNFKVHVHSNRPDEVLSYFLTHNAQISEVHIHNMQLQSDQRNRNLVKEAKEKESVRKASEQQAQSYVKIDEDTDDSQDGSFVKKAAKKAANRAKKAIGFVAVAAGAGMEKILRSLGVDQVVSGGQTMNPSTKDLLDAVSKVEAESVIILPNNSNIIMAAQSAAELAEVDCAVVPTKSVPEAFSAMFGVNGEASLHENVASMTDAFKDVQTAEVTFAVKESKDAHNNPIHVGDVIGLANNSIESVGQSVDAVVLDLLDTMHADAADSLTILAGEQISDEDFESLIKRIGETYAELDIDPLRGEQPLYPIVMSIE